MTTGILLVAAFGVCISFLAMLMRTLRSRRQRMRNPSLRLLGNVSEQWLIGHQAEKS